VSDSVVVSVNDVASVSDVVEEKKESIDLQN